MIFELPYRLLVGREVLCAAQNCYRAVMGAIGPLESRTVTGPHCPRYRVRIYPPRTRILTGKLSRAVSNPFYDCVCEDY